MGAGAFRERWTFQQRAEDANGDRRGPWEAGRTLYADVTFLRGTEAVMQDRLTGRQPVVITVRDSSLSRKITSAWRAIDSRSPDRIANITSVSPSRERGFLDILATIGGAQG